MLFGAAQKPQRGRNLHAPLRPPKPLANPLARNVEPDELPDTRAQFSAPGSLPHHLLIRPAMTLGPNPNPSLGFQAYVPRELTLQPSRLGPHEPHARNPTAT